MAKDPAINWYFDNWDGGTKLFTRHQKGCYIDLLSAQFHCGHLTIENIKQILGSDFVEWEKCLKTKFEKDENGLFFNGRIEHEILKRANEKNGKSEGGKNAMKKRWGDKYLNKILNNNLNNILNKSLETEIETDNVEKDRGMGKEKTFNLQGFFMDEHLVKEIELNESQIENTIVFLELEGKKNQIDLHPTPDKIGLYWRSFCINEGKKHEWKNNFEEVLFYFRNVLKNQLIKHERSRNNCEKSSKGNYGKSSGAISLANELAAEIGLNTA